MQRLIIFNKSQRIVLKSIDELPGTLPKVFIDRSTCSFCKRARFWLADAVLRQYVPVQEQVLLPIGLCEDSRKTG